MIRPPIGSVKNYIDLPGIPADSFNHSEPDGDEFQILDREAVGVTLWMLSDIEEILTWTWRGFPRRWRRE